MPIRGVDPERVPARFRQIFAHNPFADHFDLEVVSAEGGRATLRFPHKREHTQYQGAVQGGVVVAYADASMAVAIASIIPEGRDFVTTDLSVQFLRPITGGTAVARGEVLHLGARLIRGSAVVETEDGAVVARCIATFMIVDPRSAPH